MNQDQSYIITNMVENINDLLAQAETDHKTIQELPINSLEKYGATELYEGITQSALIIQNLIHCLSDSYANELTFTNAVIELYYLSKSIYDRLIKFNDIMREIDHPDFCEEFERYTIENWAMLHDRINALKNISE